MSKKGLPIHNSNGSILWLDGYTNKNTSGSYVWVTYLSFSYSENLLSRINGIGSSGAGSQTVANFYYDSSNRLVIAEMRGKNINIAYSSTGKIQSVINHYGNGYYLSTYSTSAYIYDYQDFSNYLYLSKSYNSRIARCYENNYLMYTSTYQFDNELTLLHEATEYNSYDGIIPPKYFTKYEKEDGARYGNGDEYTISTNTTSTLRHEDLL